MNRSLAITAGLVPALVSLALAGCGSGGGSRRPSTVAASQDPVRAVRAQLESARAAMARGDLDTAMTLFSDSYQDSAGDSKAVVRQNLANWIGTQLLSATYPVDHFLVSTDGTQVDHEWAAHFLIRQRDSGQEQAIDADGATIWHPEAGTWHIFSSRNNGYLDVLPRGSN